MNMRWSAASKSALLFLGRSADAERRDRMIYEPWSSHPATGAPEGTPSKLVKTETEQQRDSKPTPRTSYITGPEEEINNSGATSCWVACADCFQYKLVE
jgi:hypothetical protein